MGHRWIMTACALACALAAAPVEARAQEAGGRFGGMGMGVPARLGLRLQPGGTLRVDTLAAVNYVVSPFGAMMGVEAGTQMGFPFAFDSYLGGMGGRLGVLFEPFHFRGFRANVVAGAELTTSRRSAYIRPRVAFGTPGAFELEASLKWVPAGSTQLWEVDETEALDAEGCGERTFEVSMYFGELYVSGLRTELYSGGWSEVFWGGSVGLALRFYE